MSILLDLFLTFLKIGVVSFGGGYGMIPIIKDEVLFHKWLTNSELLDFIAVAESTPGPIAINLATFIGASKGGFLGSMLATLGVVLPAFIIILIIASVINGLLKYKCVQSVLKTIRPIVVGLIVSTGFTLLLSLVCKISTFNDQFVFDWRAFVILSLISIINFIFSLKKKKLSPIIIIIISAILGMIFYGLLG